jgi:hypothetical protein
MQSPLLDGAQISDTPKESVPLLNGADGAI